MSISVLPGARSSSTPSRSELPLRQLSRSLRDTLFGEAIVQILRFGGIIVLARALNPQNFGVFKILVVIGTLAVMLNEAGLPDALIQRERSGAEHEASAWWLNLAASVLTCGALYLSAAGIADLMQMPELAFTIRLICIPVLLEGITSTASARLRRELRFDLLVLADVLSEAAFLGVALVLWYKGLRQWSLPGALAARYTLHAVVTQASSGYFPRCWPRLQAARDLAPFSARVMGGRLVTLASSNADYILVGRLLGSSALGLYSIAWDMLRLVPDRVYRVVGRVAFPAFCQLRGQKAIGNAYTNIVDLIGRLVLPTAACAAIVAPQLFCDDLWSEVDTGGAAVASVGIGTGTCRHPGRHWRGLLRQGHPEIDIYLHSVRLVLIVLAVALPASAGLSAVCVSVSAAEALVTLGGQWFAAVLAGIPPLVLFRTYLSGLRTALACGLAAEAGLLVGIAARLPDATQLGAAALLATAAFVGLESSNLLHNLRGNFAQTPRGLVEVSN